ncbi:MAG: T9SS type A sorting domain-containing protein [Bacteroidetes bacterium]|nr:T9SS type A sorting domain-containing protein [Bacteroidota bacterium]
MKFFTLVTIFIWAFIGFANAQCDLSALEVINMTNQVLVADEECTDAEGWTHYYNSTNNRILFSIKKNGQDIGSINQGMTVKSGTLPSFNTGGYNLSGADYINTEIWIVANRYWQITGANPIVDSLKVRFYFTAVDISDVAQTVDDFGFLVDQSEDLYMFTISNAGGLYPLATSTQPFNAAYTLYDMFPGAQPDWTAGDFNGYPYGEFWVKNLDIGGGAGFLIFQNSDPLTISGNITRPNGTPVPDVDVKAASISMDVTDANGNYDCGTLLSGSDYELLPFKDINHKEGITVVDLIAIAQHINNSQPITDPYRLIAANANIDNIITFTDIAAIRDVLFGNSPNFPMSTSWRFVPKNYVFPNPLNPFMPQFPESILVTNLQDSLVGQDFYGIKIGDVADPSTDAPPALNTSFSLENLNACNTGDTVVYHLRVEDFQNIRGFQFTLEWDASILQFLSAANFNLVGFTNNSLGQAAINNGKLSLVWVNTQTSSGVTAANGTAICELKFVANGSIGASTPLSFTGSITDNLVVHQNLTQVVPGSNDGNFIIDNNSTITASALVQSTDCSGQANGAIDLTATGGNGTLNYLWSNGATTQDIFLLAVGEYRVTITDASGGCPLVKVYNVGTPVPIGIDAQVSDMSCAYLVDGSIELQITGGEAPFHYLWSDGSTTRINDDLYAGNYTVTVTDGAGCTSTASFDIQSPGSIMPVVNVTNASNMTSSDGSVIISGVNGGGGPFSFQWNNGATTQSLMNVPPGDYVVTITDGVGCQHVFGYEVYGLFTGTIETGSNLEAVEFYPNPARTNQEMTIVFSVKKPGKIKATIISDNGKKVAQEQFILSALRSTRQIEAPLVSGLYIVLFEMDDQPAGQLKLVVQ